MNALSWTSASPTYDLGASKGVLYLDDVGVAWPGLARVEIDSAPVVTPRYLDGVPYRASDKPADLSLDVWGFSFPSEFSVYLEEPYRLQGRSSMEFGFSFRTENEGAYSTHILYGLRAFSREFNYRSNHEETDPLRYWRFVSRGVPSMANGVVRHVTIRSDQTKPEAITEIEAILYGDDAQSARLPWPTELIDILESHAELRIIDHHDGTWTAVGPDSAIVMSSPTEFEITWPSARMINSESYTIHSL